MCRLLGGGIITQPQSVNHHLDLTKLLRARERPLMRSLAPPEVEYG